MLRRFLPCALLCCLFGGVVPGNTAHAARIEAQEGKRYSLTKSHGPWMIMVASFHTTAEDGETQIGKTPEEAADELVLELRKKGIPAYVHAMQPADEPIITVDRSGREVRRKNLRQVTSIGVLAGNYPLLDDDVAQRTLKWIKDYSPECLEDGVVFQQTEERPTPLAAAFLTINPLLTPEEIEAFKGVDTFVLRLNHSERNSLLDNEGRYTLVVATFGGKSGIQTPLGGVGGFGREMKPDDDLDVAAQEARDLAEALRTTENVEAFVWHDRYHSIVTVGSFETKNDPAIAAFTRRFGANQPTTALVPKFSNAVQYLAIDGNGQKIPDIQNINSTVLPNGFRMWAFDPTPHVLAVPRAR
jgi:hypothetical protein